LTPVRICHKASTATVAPRKRFSLDGSASLRQSPDINQRQARKAKPSQPTR